LRELVWTNRGRSICSGIARRVAGGTQRELCQPYLLVVRQLRDEGQQIIGGQGLRNDDALRSVLPAASAYDD